MSRFQHPHLTRGTVHTRAGAFAIRRGIIEAPDEIGEEFGWRRLDDEAPAPATFTPALQWGGYERDATSVRFR